MMEKVTCPQIKSTFTEVKQAATAEHVIAFLGLKLAQRRFFSWMLSLCKANSREFFITGSKRPVSLL